MVLPGCGGVLVELEDAETEVRMKSGGCMAMKAPSYSYSYSYRCSVLSAFFECCVQQLDAMEQQ